MIKYEVRLDCGKVHAIEAECVTIDPQSIRFDNRATAGKPSELIAYFPAHRVAHVKKIDKASK